MEKTEAIGAYLAEELTRDGGQAINAGGEIHILTPISNVKGFLIFSDSALEWILNRDILLLVASISSGRTVHTALDCIRYYGGSLVGISALFLNIPEENPDFNALFTCEDIPNYKTYEIHDCALCKAGHSLEAIISSEGYTRIEKGRFE
jgi:orotate phosphoribosyltransferase